MCVCPVRVQSYLIGIVVPDPEVLTDWAKERGIVGSYEELCLNPVCNVTLITVVPMLNERLCLSLAISKSFDRTLV